MILEDIIYSLPAEPSVICVQELFGNSAALELEIGTGKGGFLLQRAQAHPERNFLGIEWANQYFRAAADRMARWGVQNVRLVRADAKGVVCRCLAEASLSALHVYHPDPWPKKRHHKRRLFDAGFVDAAVAALADGARWSIQTDHREYYEVIHELLRTRGALEETLRACDNGTGGPQTVETNYQIKYRRAGRPIHRLDYRRRPRR